RIFVEYLFVTPCVRVLRVIHSQLAHLCFFFFFLIILHPPRSTLFPYTTLFRSGGIWKTSNWLDWSPIWAPLTDQPQILSQAIESDRKSTRLNSSHVAISYAVFCLKKKT